MRILHGVADEMADILVAMRSAAPVLPLFLEFAFCDWRAGGTTADLGTETNSGIHSYN